MSSQKFHKSSRFDANRGTLLLPLASALMLAMIYIGLTKWSTNEMIDSNAQIALANSQAAAQAQITNYSQRLSLISKQLADELISEFDEKNSSYNQFIQSESTQRKIRGFMKLFPELISIKAFLPSGDQVIATFGSPATPKAGLAVSSDEISDFVRKIAVVENNGRLQFFVRESQPGSSSLDTTPSIFYAAMPITRNKELLGTLLFDLNSPTFFNLVKFGTIPDSQVFIADSQGNFLFPTRVRSPDKSLGPKIQNLSDITQGFSGKQVTSQNGFLSFNGDYFNISRINLVFGDQNLAVLRAEHSDSSAISSSKIESSQRTVMFWIVLSGLIVAMFSVYVHRRFINDPLQDAANGVHKSIRTTVQTISELSQSSMDVSAGSRAQSRIIQGSSEHMYRISRLIAKMAREAEMSQSIARRVAEKTQDGIKVMDRMVKSMKAIRQANNHLDQIRNIIREISAKTNVINDIVLKTQFLSFNASIEAERAGQHGRGFAVVAEEVGSLAQLSGKAADEIRTLLDDSQNQVTSIVQNTQDRVSEGRSVMEKANTLFTEIARDIEEISEKVKSSSDLSNEQMLGIDQVTRIVRQLDESTQINTNVAEQTGQLTRQLRLLSEELKELSAPFVNWTKNDHHESRNADGDERSARDFERQQTQKSKLMTDLPMEAPKKTPGKKQPVGNSANNSLFQDLILQSKKSKNHSLAEDAGKIAFRKDISLPTPPSKNEINAIEENRKISLPDRRTDHTSELSDISNEQDLALESEDYDYEVNWDQGKHKGRAG